MFTLPIIIGILIPVAGIYSFVYVKMREDIAREQKNNGAMDPMEPKDERNSKK